MMSLLKSWTVPALLLLAPLAPAGTPVILNTERVMDGTTVCHQQADGAALAKAGTLILEFKPGPEWFSTAAKEPQMLFQMGAQHWDPNSISLIHEPSGQLVAHFNGHGDAKSHSAIDGSTFKRNAFTRLALAWDGSGAVIFANGAKAAAWAPALPQALPGLAAFGSPANHPPGWSFRGVLKRCELRTEKLSDPELAAATFIDERVPPAATPPPYVTISGKTIQVGSAALELQIATDGSPVALYDRRAGRFLTTRWPGGSLWTVTSEAMPGGTPLDSSACPAVFERKTGPAGQPAAAWRYPFPGGKGAFLVEVWGERDGALCFRYGLDNGYDKPVDFVYFPSLAGIDKSPDGWVAQPHWNGTRKAMKDFQFMCWGGPGHLSMMFMGLQTGASTLLIYPDDPAGSVRFAIANDNNSGPDGIMNLTWQNRDSVRPGEKFRSATPFRLYALGDSGLKGMAEKYREWAVKQPWFVTWEQKRAAAPVIDRALNGVVKMVGYEGVGTADSNVFAPRDYKEKHLKNLSMDYAKFLTLADGIERLYQVKPAYRYDGWWGRFDSRYPEYFPVDKELGDFKAFIAANNRAGRLVYLHTNPIQWDGENASFDLKRMSYFNPGEPGGPQIWARNKLYFCSPNLVKDDEVAAEKRMLAYGVNGIFEDVIGCTTMLDFNPHAGYPYPARDSGTRALIALCRALKDAAPGVFRGTEGGEERRLSYYDAFMIGAGDSLEDVPLLGMVYGDCYANVTGIDGGGNGDNNVERARRLLFASVLGLDGRYEWATQYSPMAQMTFETQAIAKQVTGKRILDYKEQDGRCVTQWADAVVCANLGKESCPVFEVKGTSLGTIRVEGMVREAVVLILRDGSFVSWGCHRASVNGRELFALSGSDGLAAAYDGRRLALAVGMFPKFPECQAEVRIARANFKGRAVVRPDNATAKAVGSGTSWTLTLPAGKSVFLE
ncbi:MAG: hypothetical protein WC708_14245 [Lentisphaeria bacterium]